MASSRSRTNTTRAKRDRLEELTADELRERARKKSVPGASRMRKGDLIAALRASSGASNRPSSSGPGTSSKRRPAATRSSPSSKPSTGPASRRSTKRTAGDRQGEDYRGQTLVTRDHDVIRTWAEARGAVPATVAGRRSGRRLRVLRLDFPGYGGDNLEEVSWDDWFATFDERDLDAVYQEHTSDGRRSNFFRLVREDT